jgi:16S rRNA (guanine527-N7)-methyltransferase
METSRIAALLARFVPRPLAEHQLRQLSAYLDLLLRWNERMNLTSVREPEHIVTRHFGESLFAAATLFPNEALPAAPVEAPNPAPAAASDQPPRVVDIGSGAGFPGFPIKVWAPGIHLTLIESNHKKVAFLREVARTITLTNIDVFAGRAEDYSSTANVVTLRAVERFETVLPIGIRLLVPAGRLALLIGKAQIAAASQLHGFDWSEPKLLPDSTARVLLVGSRQ